MSEIRIPPPAARTSDASGDSVDASRLLQALWRGKWYFLLLPALTAGGMHAWLRGQRNLYRTTAQVQVSPREVDPLKGSSSSSNKARTVLKQQQILVKSPAILKPLSESEQIRGLRSFSKRIIGDKPLITELNDRLGTVVDPNTDRLSIAYLSPFPDEAARVARATVEQYLQYHREKKRRSAQESADILRGEVEKNRADMQELNEKIIALKTENNIIQGGETFIESRLNKARERWNTARSEMIEHEATLAALEEAEKDEASFLELGQNRRSTKQNPNLESELQDVEKELRDKEVQLERRSREEGEKLLEDLRLEIATLKERRREVLLQYARSYKVDTEIAFHEARRLASSLESDVAGLREELARTNAALQKIANYEKEYELVSGFTESLKSRLEELDVENQTGALNIDVIDYGRPSTTPASPDRVGMMMYALAGGFGLAFAIVLLRSFTDRRLRTAEEVSRALSLNVVGAMPRIRGARARKRAARVVEEQPASPAAEAFRNLRTAVTFALPKGGNGIVLVTSAIAGEGKSVTASNLAYALAMGGRRTLLVDGDLRVPGLHTAYGVANASGLGQVLTRSTKIDRAIVQNVAAGLDLLPGGDPFGKPAELFESELFPELIAYLRTRYDCIVLDSAPVLESSEARVMASEVDLAVFVARLGVSTGPGAARALDLLRAVDARVIGTFLTDDRRKKPSSYGGPVPYGAARADGSPRPAAPRRDAEG